MNEKCWIAIGNDLRKLDGTEPPVQRHENLTCTLAGKAGDDLIDGIAPEKGNTLRERSAADNLDQQAGCAGDSVGK